MNLSSFDISNVTDMGYMFYNAKNLTQIWVGPKWDETKVSSSTFGGCGVNKVTPITGQN